MLRALQGKLQTDALRVFWTAWLIYAAFWNPWLQSSMTYNFLDAAVSFVDTGRWEMTHAYLYRGYDTVTVNGRVVSAHPPGVAVLLIPLYGLWRNTVGPVDTPEEFQVFNAALVLVLCASIAALIVVQVFWLTGWLGAGRRGQLLTAALVAFGTPNFFLGTVLFKESFAALAVLTAFRLALVPGGGWRMAAAGGAAGSATVFALQCGLIWPLLLALVGWREGAKRGVVFLLGLMPAVILLGIYNWWLFGQPWRSGYFYAGDATHPSFLLPKAGVLLDLLAGPHGGVFLYSPFLLLACAGVVVAWRTGRRGEAAVAVLFMVGLWLGVGAHQSEYSDQATHATNLGHRMLYPTVPLLAGFAGYYLDRLGGGALLLFAVPALFCGYLSAQAGVIPDPGLFTYAIKTWISGTGMGVLFKEALPVWLGLDTLHTVVSRPDVSARDLLYLLPTDEGLRLVRNQAFFFSVNLAVLGSLFWLIKKLWLSGTGGSVLAADCDKRAGRG
jgi:hypothetical protein